MISRRSGNRTIVRCDLCPGQPALPTPNEDVSTAKCIRCQDDNRWLPVPHPDDHLCSVCRRECPVCRSVTTGGGVCLTCQALCRTCRRPLPARPDLQVRVVEPGNRKDRKRRWSRHFFLNAKGRDQCDACLDATRSPDPLRAVLAALPDKAVRACGGGIPPAVVDTLRAELRRRTVRQLGDRIERRWWNRWASLPLHRDESDDQPGYRPDDVMLWLVTPTPCPGGCEDGFVLDNPDRICSICRGTSLTHLADEGGEDAQPLPQPAAARTPAEAIAYRPPVTECTGKGGTCGVPVAPPHTQCPSCSNWPRCACGRRHNPAHDACRTCSSHTNQSHE
ncbi:hypothetical protein GCM10023324_56620 [Streptomyces youssoufiensis]